MSELLFEKEYQLLQEIGYPYKGAEKKTKNVLLKAPTFKQSEKLEVAHRQVNRMTAMANFICDAGLITTKEDGIAISSPLLNDLHITAIMDLVINYGKFFLVLEQSEEETKSIA